MNDHHKTEDCGTATRVLRTSKPTVMMPFVVVPEDAAKMAAMSPGEKLRRIPARLDRIEHLKEETPLVDLNVSMVLVSLGVKFETVKVRSLTMMLDWARGMGDYVAITVNEGLAAQMLPLADMLSAATGMRPSYSEISGRTMELGIDDYVERMRSTTEGAYIPPQAFNNLRTLAAWYAIAAYSKNERLEQGLWNLMEVYFSGHVLGGPVRGWADEIPIFVR